MSKNIDFLSSEDEHDIINAIRTAEKQTSGEIRVHIENTLNTDISKRVMDVFHELKMDATQLQNGVLIYVAIASKAFAIYGDKGINDVVPHDFWDSTKDIMQQHFKTGHLKQGLIDGILKAGEQLQVHFPWQHDNIDELPNEISKG